METIKTKIHIDSEGWIKIKAPVEYFNQDAEAILIFNPTLESVKNNEQALQALQNIAKTGGLDIKDPSEWQREIRKDRPLPGRED